MQSPYLLPQESDRAKPPCLSQLYSSQALSVFQPMSLPSSSVALCIKPSQIYIARVCGDVDLCDLLPPVLLGVCSRCWDGALQELLSELTKVSNSTCMAWLSYFPGQLAECSKMWQDRLAAAEPGEENLQLMRSGSGYGLAEWSLPNWPIFARTFRSKQPWDLLFIMACINSIVTILFLFDWSLVNRWGFGKSGVATIT